MQEDDIITIEVEVEPTDHPMSHHGLQLPITMQVGYLTFRLIARQLFISALVTIKKILQVNIDGVNSVPPAVQNIRLIRSGFEFMKIVALGRNPNTSTIYPRM